MEINEAAKKTKLKAHTLRYYENIGLITDIERDSSGKRSYTEKDILWIEFLKRLKNTGMKIKEMKKYADLKNSGKSTVSERKKMLINHSAAIETELKMLSETLEYINCKIEIYNKMEADENGEQT